MTDETTDDGEGVQPTLPDLGLPEFEGISPVDVTTSVNGSGSRIRRAVHHGEKLILVIEAEVNNIAHPRTKKGIVRNQVLSVLDLYELKGDQGTRLLSTLRTAYKKQDDERHGRKALPGIDDKPKTDHGQTLDGDGTALLDGEVAEARGDVLAEAGIEAGPKPIVLVFDDGTRAVWPDEFSEPGDDYPEAGDELIPPDGKKHVLIRKVLDSMTAEVLDEWTEADEEAYLLEQEKVALEKERAEKVKPIKAAKTTKAAKPGKTGKK